MANEICRRRGMFVLVKFIFMFLPAIKQADSMPASVVTHNDRSSNVSDLNRNDVTARDRLLHTAPNMTEVSRSANNDANETAERDANISDGSATSREAVPSSDVVNGSTATSQEPVPGTDLSFDGNTTSPKPVPDTGISSYENATSITDISSDGGTTSQQTVSSAYGSYNGNATSSRTTHDAEEVNIGTSDPLTLNTTNIQVTLPEPPIFVIPEILRPPVVVTVGLQPVLTHILAEPSPFERVETLFADFESQMVALHSALCGTTCTFHFTDSRRSRAFQCSTCFCDDVCYLYDDCCPDVQLLDSRPMESFAFYVRPEELKARDLYTCEVSHVRSEPDLSEYKNYFSMINYCPRTNDSQVNHDDDFGDEGRAGPSAPGSSQAGGSRDGLETKCENRGSQDHWDYHRPLSSRQGLVYRNKFCAQCHGEHRDNLTDWMTKVTCDADVLYTVSSASEAYSVALNTSGCKVWFESTTYLSYRDCNYVIAPVISSCNETGLWKAYDQKVERACASFTSVVRRKYKNVFCYLCNNDVNYRMAHYFLGEGMYPNIVGRVTFFALLDLPASDVVGSSAGEEEDGTETTVDSRNQCDVGMVLDPLGCQCRRVTCAAGFRLEGDNCTEVFAFTNYFGLRVNSRFLLTSDQPINTSVFNKFIKEMKRVQPVHLSVEKTTSAASLGCHDYTTLAVDMSMEVYSTMAVPLREMAHTTLGLLRSFAQGVHIPLVNVTVVTPSADAARLPEWPNLIPDACPTKLTSFAMGKEVVIGEKIVGVGQDVSFSTLYNTTFCPRVNLTEAEFGNFTSRLHALGLAESDITYDVIYVSGMTFYFVCVEDYNVILPQDACLLTEANNPSEIKTADTFEDDWTPGGITSLVCTCISLVSLLCVIVSYAALPPLREGTGLCTLAMVCLLFVAQALHELGLEQYEIQQLCLVLAVLIHFFWLSAVFMMTSCTLHIFYSVTFPLRARARLDPGRALGVSLLASFSLTAAIIGSTMLANQLVFGDLGYPAKYLCFIRRGLSRRLGFCLPVGLAVLFNVVIFLIAMFSIRRRPLVSSTQQDRISLVACVRLSIVTGACWLTLFLAAIPPIRAWLDYVTSALLGMQGLLLASTLLLNGRVAGLWRHLLLRWRKRRAARHDDSQQTSSTRSTDIHRNIGTSLASREVSHNKHEAADTRDPALHFVCKL